MTSSAARPLRRRCLTAVVVATVLAMLMTSHAPAAAPPDQQHEISYDRYSLTIDGQRVLLWSGEFHYFRLPSPGLWRDVLERIRAAGFNGVSLYFHWGYHSPKPGVYDFTGVRDVDRLLRMADELGLYVVVRPGPYINAETTGGGFPAWLKTVPGRARSSDPGYTEHYRDWLRHINPIIARHQITRGGAVVAYNVENEYAVNVDAAYMEDLQAQARAAGIDVPITHNNCCSGGLANWSSGQGAVEIPGVDDYPQSFDCPNPDVWGPWGDGITRRLVDDAPVYAAKYQAGAIDLNDTGYELCRKLTGPGYMKYFYKSNLIASGATMFGYYMTFGGTSWGWLPQPNDVYTSYDYGAAITEHRQLTGKYDEFKRQGYFVTSVAPLTRTDPITAPVSSNPNVQTLARANPDTGTQFVLVRQVDSTAAAADATLEWTAPDGNALVPVRVSSRDAKILVAGYDMGGQRLAWSSSKIMTHATIGSRDVALLYGRDGEPGSTALRYDARPNVNVVAGGVDWSYSDGVLRLDYTHTGLGRVAVSGGGRRPLLLLLGTDEAAATFWRAETTAGPVLVRGTSLVRSARMQGRTIALRADTADAGDVEVFGPASAERLLVGDANVRVNRTPSGSLLGRVPGPAPVHLPTLTNWRVHREAPEAVPDFDDYGFHHGNVWYRGHFTATGAETTVSLNAITGRKGVYLVWLNERFKQPRGLVGAAIAGLDTPIRWRIQGAHGGQDLADPARGPLNTGGLYGERSGWHLPGYRDRSWAVRRGLSDARVAPGVTWYRTTFDLALPKDQDVPVALRLAGSSGPWRALVFLNGWNVGQYLNQRGPQHDFALPAGLLRQRGENTLALAVIAQDDAVVGPVQLVTMGNHRGGVPVRAVRAPSYDPRSFDR